ncbi:hypothetical protein GCM10010124_00060 [Pilimelia terevasa]|uniref:Uncharacterized protein n=1 Tax=Pilimelia terevasa TaxID=53372 RepID=A0A8J3BI00_9ACTN|nr:RRQRL motif-containing zinc-binding protein [Pilimelia terevasa]GGK11427.1 hypothetical protein GCM10010124_00060 [Pilimelia terevasa]
MGRIAARFHDPDGERYGLPTFWWRGAPAGYATVRQLRADGLRPGGQDVAAQIRWRGVGGVRVANLYRVDRALPKRTATPAQRRAIDAALAARRTCSTCGSVCGYYIPRSLGECLDCAEGTAC